MSQHQHPRSKAAFDSHHAAVRRLERDTAKHLDRLYAAARAHVLAHVDQMLADREREQFRVAALNDWPAEPEDEDEPPKVSNYWLAVRLPVLTQHIEQTMTQYADAAGAIITRAHVQVTADGAAAAHAVLVGRAASPVHQVRPLPEGTLASLAGRAGNGQPVASLLDGLGRKTASEIERTVRVACQMDRKSAQIRHLVTDALDSARNRVQTALTDCLWRGNGDAMMATYRANRGA